MKYAEIFTLIIIIKYQKKHKHIYFNKLGYENIIFRFKNKCTVSNIWKSIVVY